MISLRRNKKPLLLENVKIDVIGDKRRLVVMDIETIDHRKVTFGMLPETAFSILEDLSMTALAISKKDEQELNNMYR